MKYIAWISIVLPILALISSLILWGIGQFNLSAIGWVRIAIGCSFLLFYGIVSLRKYRNEVEVKN